MTFRPDSASRLQGLSDRSIQVTTELNGRSHVAQAPRTLVDHAASAPESHTPASAKSSSFQNVLPHALPIAAHRFAFRQPSLRIHSDCCYVAELAMAVQRSVHSDVAMEE
jgi:hypothetical protein